MLPNTMTDNDNHNVVNKINNNNNNNSSSNLQHRYDDDNNISISSTNESHNINTNNNNNNNTNNNNADTDSSNNNNNNNNNNTNNINNNITINNNNNNNNNNNVDDNRNATNDKNIEIELKRNVENAIAPPAKPLKSILRLKTPEIYQEPTPTPLPTAQIAVFNAQANLKKTTEKPAKKKRVDKNDLGDDFVAPDGGWGWVVTVASGINILVTFAMAQQFGIIFREHLANMGVNNSELTTIINIQLAVSALTGLLNGPIFRNYTYRQVALVGSVLTVLGLVLLVFANSFTTFVLYFSVMYAFGRGLTTSASSLAVNTYFKLKRRNAIAYQFAVAGLGPIFYPYLATFLMRFYGVRGTVLVFGGLALNTIACSLIYQPVLWHVKKKELSDMEKVPQTPEQELDLVEQVVEPDTPGLPRANDGWFGSRTSLNMSSSNLRNRLSMVERENEMYYGQVTELKRLNSRERSRTVSMTPSIIEEEDDEEMYDYNEFMPKRKTRLPEGVAYKEEKSPEPELHELGEEARQKLPFYKKIVIFFDLDLLRDVTYINLACGLMIINFVEINFAILTPFILSDFGFNGNQIAFAMSSLGFCDLVLRFLIPAITFKLSRLSNKFLFSVGILGMCIGRFFLAFTRDFYSLIAVFIFLGICKAFRTIFWTLIIPSYVPLKRLPAASGLQLLMSGIFSTIFGPIIGLIRDNTNYVVTLIVLNVICLIALLLWLVEWFVRRSKHKSKVAPEDIIKS